MKKFLQEKNLKDYFDVSPDYFKIRKGTEFIEGVHFFIPPNSSKTKKVIFWNIEAVENWLKGHNNIDSDLEALLDRV